ncbi:dihydrodipicolinate synthase family protein [Nonomuraea polychroma]|uniref:dihydrodipicolinate synthase family protein n=1 Tax=Nonomuraea polychroma TaxID=46176 RepID=UPI003D94AE6A
MRRSVVAGRGDDVQNPLWRAAGAAGADALVVSPPTYVRHREDEVVAHYAAMARYGLPVIAYNAPRYATPLTPSCVAAR